MKIILAVFVAFVGVNALSKEKFENLVERVKFCAEKSGLENEVAKNYKYAIVETNEINESYFKCFFQKFEFMDDAGVLKPQVIISDLSEGKSEEMKIKLKQLIEKCTTATAGKTLTALKVHNCYIEGSEKETFKTTGAN